jgi:hypothetical protein
LQLERSREAEQAATETKRSKEIKIFAEVKFILTNSEKEWNQNVVNSKTAQAIVMGGIVVSFSVIIIGESLNSVKKIIMKPIFRKRDKNVGCSTDLY